MTKKIVSLSFPRSGATFVRYFVKTLLGLSLQTAMHDDYMHNIPYAKMHYPPQHFPIKDISCLILCVRDYKECITRHYVDDLDSIISSSLEEQFNSGDISIYKNIEFYDNFVNKKIVIYYEDLITQTEIELKKLANLINIDCTSFLENIEYHKQQSIKEYSTHINKSYSQGKSIDYHQSALSTKQKIHMDKQAKFFNPYLYDKYLRRYKYETNIV